MQRRRSTDAKVPGEKSGAAESDEARLVSRIAEGDRYAFEALYHCYFPRLTRFLNRMMRSVQLIEEVVNDTMLVVWQKAHTYDYSSKVSTWIFAIAYRKALKAIQFSDEPVEADFDQYLGEGKHEPEQIFTRHELEKIVAGALDALPMEQRMVVNLAYYHDMGYGEIAEVMECPVNTVKTRMFHARRRLKTLLSGQLEET